MAAELPIKRGKRGAAAFIQTAVCSTTENLSAVDEILDVVLDPTKPIDDWNTADWCRWLLAGGRTPEEYAQTVRRYDNATTCGLVWTANFVAYRCRTCGISPCMSLCSDCFQRGNHEGHDFNMFRSQAGGACDCGDKSVMKESGFCSKHCPNAHLGKPAAPPDLLSVASLVMPRIILRLIQHLRDHSKPPSLDRYLTAIQEVDGFLTMLHQHSEMGAAMREVMTQALNDSQAYTSLALNCDHPNPERAAYLKQNFDAYQEAKCSLDFPFTASTSCDMKTLNQVTLFLINQVLEHSTFLEELVFWTVKYEFPQKLVCLLLNMMPDLNYKEAFTKTFVHHYSRISKILAKSTDSDTLSNRVVHVSVQLFSNEELAYKMTKEFSLLHVMVVSLSEMMGGIAQRSVLQCAERNDHLVVDCSHRIMKEHCYWPLVSDLNNVLTHRPVALEFLNDIDLLHMWFSFLSLFQGMNVNQRELKTHVEFESNTYYAAFSAELEASATPMWALISHLKDSNTLEQTKKVLTECLQALNRWFLAIGFSLSEKINSYQVSFHLPLHRCFAAFLCQAVRNQNAKLSEVVPSQEMLQLLMMHPLQAQVAFQEILCGMWVRSGLQIKGQAMTYIQCHFCNSIVDADLFLLQLCSTHLDPDWFLKTVMQRFHVWEWLTFHPNRVNSFLEPEHVLPMLEGALNFLTTLMATHTNIGQTEEEVTRQEMVSLLCMSDRTHSQLLDLLPEKCGITSQNKDFESILTKVADYKAPNFEAGGTMLQGMYVPKPEIWEKEYDPIHILLRAVHRRDYQASLDRYTQYLRQSGKYKGTSAPWPPFRVPGKVHKEFLDPRQVLHSKTMHGIIFTVLFRAVHEKDLPEQVLALCIYLLDMAVQFPPPSCNESAAVSGEVTDFGYSDWFPTKEVLKNIFVTVKKVVTTDKTVMSMGMVEEMEIDEEEEEMDLEAEFTTYHVQSPIIEEDTHENLNDVEASAMPAEGGTTALALPPTASGGSTDLVPVTKVNDVYPCQQYDGSVQYTAPSTSTVTSPSGPNTPSTSTVPGNKPSLLGTLSLLSLPPGNSDVNMAIVPTSVGVTTMRPRCLKLKHVPGRHRMLLTDQGLPPVAGGESLRALPYSGRRAVEVNESIFSLLIVLHSKLSKKPDSYKPPSEKNIAIEEDSRIGDGTYFIEKLLDRIATSVPEVESAMNSVRRKLWPKQEEEKPPGDSEDKEERRRKAKERQQKLIAEFASRQRAFLQKTMEEDAAEAPSASLDKDSILNMAKEYECVICGQTAASDEEKPMGMVILLQATSVVGHCDKEPPESRHLPRTDEERLNLKKENTMAYYIENRIDQLSRHFDSNSLQKAINIGWEGGVHVQSCGHYLHLSCHKAYMLSLRNMQSSRHQSLAVERGEYSCPLCRQLANSVIPLHPKIGEMSAVVCCKTNTLQGLSAEIYKLMESCAVSSRDTNILKWTTGIVEDLTNCTYPHYRSVCPPNNNSLFLFVCSISRTNLEVELVQRGGTLCSAPKKKSCFVPLLHILSLHAKLIHAPLKQLWLQVTGLPSEDDMSSVAVPEKEVPLLLRDTTALLIQIILTLPLNIDKAYYCCVIQVLYNVVYVQAVAQLSCLINQSQRTHYKNTVKVKTNCTEMMLGLVISHLEHSFLYVGDEDLGYTERTKQWTLAMVESYIQSLCLPFLRIAALLQSHFFGEESINVPKPELEFGHLCKYLGLASQVLDASSFDSATCLNWAVDDPHLLIQTWCQEYISFVNKSVIAARRLLQRQLIWYPPALLRLPQNYDQIFQYYHRRPCTVCHSVPKDPSLCLVCGTMVCLREHCCRQQPQYEAVFHSISCGAGTAMFLAVNSSTIIVIRGKRACLWGSVYLDSFGEEDRDLKRGKPLYLSEDRYNLLQQQWINHSFDHTNKRWVWHKDNL